jgi:hypothetical protein
MLATESLRRASPLGIGAAREPRMSEVGRGQNRRCRTFVRVGSGYLEIAQILTTLAWHDA